MIIVKFLFIYYLFIYLFILLAGPHQLLLVAFFNLLYKINYVCMYVKVC